MGIGSFLGGIIRFKLSYFTNQKVASTLPLGTLLVNVAGCFAIGILYFYFEKQGSPQSWRLLLITGLLGGFTTFSAFGLETFQLLKLGQIAAAFAYIFLSVALGLLATYLGYRLMR